MEKSENRSDLMIKVDVFDSIPERKIVVATKDEINRSENVKEFLDVLKVHELVWYYKIFEIIAVFTWFLHKENL